jgi:Uma2 family endonuclease
MMSIVARTRMTSDEFIAWAMRRPDGERWELVGGELVAMSPERSGHALVKARVWRALDDAIRAAGLGCTAYPDGMAVEIDDSTVYEPDALVRCGEPLDDDAVKVTDALIVVEVLSPSSKARDAGAKLADYVRLPSLRHYLLVDIKTRAVVHHQIGEAAGIHTRILREGPLDLDPPGIRLELADLFA